MSKAGAHTHGQFVAGTPSSATGDTLLGSFTLPAGGPWIIHNVYGQCVNDGALTGAGIHPAYVFRPATSDISPYPAPSRFPFAPLGHPEGVITWRASAPLTLFPVHWVAQGLAKIDILTSLTEAGQGTLRAIVGCLYSTIPSQILPASFSERVYAVMETASEIAIGTITLSEGARRLTGVMALLSQPGDGVMTNSLAGTIRLDSADFAITPAEFPFSNIFGTPESANQPPTEQKMPVLIPLNIPVPRGARIDITAKLLDSPTQAAAADIYLQYE